MTIHHWKLVTEVLALYSFVFCTEFMLISETVAHFSLAVVIYISCAFFNVYFMEQNVL